MKWFLSLLMAVVLGYLIPAYAHADFNVFAASFDWTFHQRLGMVVWEFCCIVVVGLFILCDE